MDSLQELTDLVVSIVDSGDVGVELGVVEFAHVDVLDCFGGDVSAHTQLVPRRTETCHAMICLSSQAQPNDFFIDSLEERKVVEEFPFCAFGEVFSDLNLAGGGGSQGSPPNSISS